MERQKKCSHKQRTLGGTFSSQLLFADALHKIPHHQLIGPITYGRCFISLISNCFSPPQRLFLARFREVRPQRLIRGGRLSKRGRGAGDAVQARLKRRQMEQTVDMGEFCSVPGLFTGSRSGGRSPRQERGGGGGSGGVRRCQWKRGRSKDTG